MKVVVHFASSFLPCQQKGRVGSFWVNLGAAPKALFLAPIPISWIFRWNPGDTRLQAFAEVQLRLPLTCLIEWQSI